MNPGPGICLGGGVAISSDKSSSDESKLIARLLASTNVVRDACDLDLLVFLQRHPRTLVTSEQLSAFVGYDIKHIAKSLDAFLEGGLLERTQNPLHAARLYLLVLDGPQDEGLRELLKIGSTRQGRREILRILDPGGSQSNSSAQQLKHPSQRHHKLKIVKIA